MTDTPKDEVGEKCDVCNGRGGGMTQITVDDMTALAALEAANETT